MAIFIINLNNSLVLIEKLQNVYQGDTDPGYQSCCITRLRNNYSYINWTITKDDVVNPMAFLNKPGIPDDLWYLIIGFLFCEEDALLIPPILQW